MLVKFSSIVWETDGEEVELPSEVVLEVNVDDEAVLHQEAGNILSGEFGFLVKECGYEILNTAEGHAAAIRTKTTDNVKEYRIIVEQFFSVRANSPDEAKQKFIDGACADSDPCYERIAGVLDEEGNSHPELADNMNEKETTWQEDVDTLLALLEELTPEEEEEIRRDPAATAALRRLYDAIADTLGKK